MIEWGKEWVSKWVGEWESEWVRGRKGGRGRKRNSYGKKEREIKTESGKGDE